MPGWWDTAIGYQIYVRSFVDSDGDGVGDLAGVRTRLDYLADLGVDTIWLTPVHPSPQADHGYDVADYLDVDPVFGSLDELDDLLAEAHELDLKVLLDLVPNHTSDQHPWFLDARSSRQATHRDFYVWKDPAPDGGPPNNWVSHFGGPAWTLDEGTGQYYLHLFLPEQPDLNWANPAVQRAFEDILSTWLDRGIDGMRIDVAHSLVKDAAFRDNPELDELPAWAATSQRVFDRFSHLHDLDQDGVLDVYRSWRAIADAHDAVLLGEVYLLEPTRLARYVTGDGLHAAFGFMTLKVPWDADAIRSHLRAHVDAGGSSLAWPLSSHDDPRAASRFGGGAVGAERALAYLTLLCALPGVPFLYQGDELGLDDAELDPGSAQDPVALRNPGMTGRDPMRTPMPWSAGPGFGFTTGEPWLPFGTNRRDDQTVTAQLGDPGSVLERTRALLEVRRGLSGLTADPDATWLTDEGPVILVERAEEIVVALHVGDGQGPAQVELPTGSVLLYGSGPEVRVVDATLFLPEDTAAIVAVD